MTLVFSFFFLSLFFKKRFYSTEHMDFQPSSPLADSNCCSFTILPWTNGMTYKILHSKKETIKTLLLIKLGTLIDLRNACLSVRLKLPKADGSKLDFATNQVSTINSTLHGLIKSCSVFLNDVPMTTNG